MKRSVWVLAVMVGVTQAMGAPSSDMVWETEFPCAMTGTLLAAFEPVAGAVVK